MMAKERAKRAAPKALAYLAVFKFKTKNGTLERFYTYMSHGSVGIVQKIDFEIRPDLGCTTIKTSRKVVLTIGVSVLMSLFLRALTGVRVNRSN